MPSSGRPEVPCGKSWSLLRFTIAGSPSRMLTNLRVPFRCSPSDARVSPGLSYHLSEIWLTELDKASASASATATRKPVPLNLVLAPFLTLAAQTPNKVTYQHIHTNLIDPLLDALSHPPEPGESPLPKRPKPSDAQVDFSGLLANSCLSPSDQPLDRSRLLKGILEYIFEVASREDTKGSNRRKLYAICNANLDDDDS